MITYLHYVIYIPTCVYVHVCGERDKEWEGGGRKWGERKDLEYGEICNFRFWVCLFVFFFFPIFHSAFTRCLYTLVWKIPWTEEPGRLQSLGSRRVGYDWVTSLSLLTFMHWRRKWQPTPVFLPGESQGRGSLVGCRLLGCTELDTTEAT